MVVAIICIPILVRTTVLAEGRVTAMARSTDKAVRKNIELNLYSLFPNNIFLENIEKFGIIIFKERLIFFLKNFINVKIIRKSRKFLKNSRKF